jgi:hypothetical protein
MDRHLAEQQRITPVVTSDGPCGTVNSVLPSTGSVAAQPGGGDRGWRAGDNE